jgi:hypothetical protein
MTLHAREGISIPTHSAAEKHRNWPLEPTVNGFGLPLTQSPMGACFASHRLGASSCTTSPRAGNLYLGLRLQHHN